MGDDSTQVSVIENFQGVEGLTLSVVRTNGQTFRDYGIPQWLWDAYGGRYETIVRELEAGALANRWSKPC